MNQLSTQEQINILSSQIDYISNKKRLLFCVPESAGDIFLSTSLLPSLANGYPDHDIYFACKLEFADILKNNPYIKQIIGYLPIMENQILMEGTGDWRGIFDISIMVTILTQRFLGYLNNGNGRLLFNVRT